MVMGRNGMLILTLIGLRIVLTYTLA